MSDEHYEILKTKLELYESEKYTLNNCLYEYKKELNKLLWIPGFNFDAYKTVIDYLNIGYQKLYKLNIKINNLKEKLGERNENN